MINFSILISNSEINGPGGIFDFNATLPFVAIQFILSAAILNIFLYSPLLNIIEERREYILTYLNRASKILKDANRINKSYEQKLANARKNAKSEITNSQKTYKGFVEKELNESQKFIDSIINVTEKYIFVKRREAFKSLDKIVQSLCDEIEAKLLL